MQGLFVELIAWGELHEGAEVHDSDSIGDVFNHRKVVGDEEVGEIHLLLKLFEQVDHLRLDGDVES